MPIGRAYRRRFLRTALGGLVGLPLAARLATVSIALGQETEPTDAPPLQPEALPAELPIAPPAEAEFVPTGVPPISLAIPGLGVKAAVVGVTQDPDGAMEAPANPDQVGWYALGPGMGVAGNVVLAAHVNWGGLPRVFAQLESVEAGAVVLIVDADGNGYQYVIESRQWVRAETASVEEIFAQTDEPILTLITCGGEYRADTREYLDRLIVRARGA